MNVAVIANPFAGRGRAARCLRSLCDRARALGRPLDVHYSRAPGHARDLAASLSAEADVVCAVGGDGTVHEVANGLMPNPVPLAVVPCGSGNDFARLVACPRTADELLAVLDAGVGVPLDVIDLGERYCVNSCGLGFEAQVTRHSRSIRHLKGLPLYLVALVRAMAEFHCPRLQIALDDGTVVEEEHLLVSVGNGVSAGGGFFLTPDAVPDDGLMDVCVVEKMGRARMLGLLPLSLRGTHTTRREVRMFRTRSLSVESEGPIHLHVDGEYLGDDRRSIRFSVLDRRLPVLCKPEGAGRHAQTPRRLL